MQQFFAYVLEKHILFLFSISLSLLCDSNGKIFTFLSAAKVLVLCYLLAQYVNVTLL